MEQVGIIVVGAVVAGILDWSIYTHLSTYLRAGLVSDRYLGFGDLLSTALQRMRFLMIIFAGAAGGWAIAFLTPTLWVLALVVFSIAHSLIYFWATRR